ncbi:MAG: PAS domain-containing protein [Acidobacteria bacterium]|nr:PAS domain-containing protein [Acidobacteriota bacterium]
MTERERELLDLQQSLARTARDWQRTIDALGFPILVLDEAGHVLEASTGSGDLLDQGQEAVLGRRVQTLGQSPLWSEVVGAVEELLAGDWPSVFRQIRVPESNTTWEVSAHRMPETPESEPAILVTARDISSLVALQEAVARRETTEALGSLVAGVAHEVRNPVFAITARCESILSSVREEGEIDRPLLTEDVEALMRSTRRLGGLMRALLEYGKPAGDSLFQGRPEQLIDEAVQDCAEIAAARGVEVRVHKKAVASTLLVDQARVVGALRNLITNAIQFSPPNGTVHVRVELSKPANGGGRGRAAKGPEPPLQCRFVIDDEGPGFPPEDLSRLGTPFFSRRRGGTGLGLAIAQRVADQFGGSLTLRNRNSKGGRVELSLPLLSAAPGGSGLDQQGG